MLYLACGTVQSRGRGRLPVAGALLAGVVNHRRNTLGDCAALSSVQIVKLSVSVSIVSALARKERESRRGVR